MVKSYSAAPSREAAKSEGYPERLWLMPRSTNSLRVTPLRMAQVRREPGGRALDTSRMAETPPGSSYNGNLAGASSSPAFAPAIFVRRSNRIAFGGCWSMRKSEVLEFHEREAARYRRLAANVTTRSLKTRFAEQAKEHERLAKELSDELVLADA